MSKGWSIICSIGIVVLMSCYFFPLNFTFFPARLNTKMLFGILGLVWFALDTLRTSNLKVDKHLFASAVFAILFSLACYASIVHCGTNDKAYVTYFFSFFVWLFGAYFVSLFVRMKHGKVTVNLITQYLAFVAVVQCFSALLIDNNMAFSNFIDRFLVIGQEFYREVDRLYGLGAALDPAGVRFSIILILIAHVLSTETKVRSNPGFVAFYVISFLVISVIGNMISRTTSTGMMLGLAYFLIASFNHNKKDGKSVRIYRIAFWFLVATVVFATWRYSNSPEFRSQMRFAFEGFFNWVETGKWSTGSTDKLNAVMWIWPKTTDAWIWGTGLFGGWVYGTDIGYCRFILYCGLIGFSVFVLFFFQNSISLAVRYPESKWLALAFLIMTFVVWIKVATDVFFIYALLYHLDPPEYEDEIEEIEE